MYFLEMKEEAFSKNFVFFLSGSRGWKADNNTLGTWSQLPQCGVARVTSTRKMLWRYWIKRRDPRLKRPRGRNKCVKSAVQIHSSAKQVLSIFETKLASDTFQISIPTSYLMKVCHREQLNMIYRSICGKFCGYRGLNWDTLAAALHYFAQH